MKIIQTKDQLEGEADLTNKISTELKKSNKVLWLIPGGSNIPISVAVMNKLHTSVVPTFLKNLSITLTDERYGPVGYKDSNWKQLEDAGMNFKGIRTFPVLNGSSLIDTINRYGDIIKETIDSTDIVVGQFGMGADGHIAGILPYSIAVTEQKPVCAYEAGPFTRITITFPTIKKIDTALVFAFGSNKKEAIELLRDKKLPLVDQPVQILKQIPEVNFYTDQ